MRGILHAGRIMPANPEPKSDGRIKEGVEWKMEAAPEDKKELEPEKEKKSQVQEDGAGPDYCSMETIAERWKDKPKKEDVVLTQPVSEDEVKVKTVASTLRSSSEKNPTLLLAELL